VLLINDLKVEIYRGDINYLDLKILAIKKKYFMLLRILLKLRNFMGMAIEKITL